MEKIAMNLIEQYHIGLQSVPTGALTKLTEIKAAIKHLSRYYALLPDKQSPYR